ncbi:MAG: TIGR04283 family arsenosugar biosynthesis glycosyltransferase [Marinosulfonomonas sp.]|nr:TIGR04283 family arsenosugar biosynthesis glycosyltransferase [Marinosulfonomonas sp.]
MPAPLSIVIPTLNSAADLPETLACLIEGLDAGLVRELIVSDGGSDDATVVIGGDVGAQVVVGPAGRGGQLQRGAAAAKGDWMLFLHADTHLPVGWAGVVTSHIAGRKTAGYFRLQFRAGGIAPKFVAGWANLRSRLGLPYGDQGLLISAQLYQDKGGYSDVALMEDVAMARRLRGCLDGLPATVLTSADKYLRQGWFRRGARNLWTLTRYLAGVSPDKLARAYNRD